MIFSIYELVEIQRVLNNILSGINNFLLYRPQIQDSVLSALLEKQLSFLIYEYNTYLEVLQDNKKEKEINYPGINFQPVYGINLPQTYTPRLSRHELRDEDFARAILAFHKSAAQLRLRAALEYAQSKIRRLLQQGAINSAEEAYEVWQYLNQRGYYQLPLTDPEEGQVLLSFYQKANLIQLGPELQEGEITTEQVSKV